MTRRVHAADGHAWVVRRHWLCFRPRWRGRTPDTSGPWDVADGVDLGFGFDDELGIGAIVAAISIVVVVIALSLVFALPLLILLAELVAFLLMGAGVLVANVVLRRPWIVEARTHDGRRWYRWAVVGFRRTERIMDAVSSALRSGIELEVSVPPGQAKLIEAHRREDRYARGRQGSGSVSSTGNAATTGSASTGSSSSARSKPSGGGGSSGPQRPAGS